MKAEILEVNAKGIGKEAAKEETGIRFHTNLYKVEREEVSKELFTGSYSDRAELFARKGRWTDPGVAVASAVQWTCSCSSLATSPRRPPPLCQLPLGLCPSLSYNVGLFELLDFLGQWVVSLPNPPLLVASAPFLCLARWGIEPRRDGSGAFPGFCLDYGDSRLTIPSLQVPWRACIVCVRAPGSARSNIVTGEHSSLSGKEKEAAGYSLHRQIKIVKKE